MHCADEEPFSGGANGVAADAAVLPQPTPAASCTAPGWPPIILAAGQPRHTTGVNQRPRPTRLAVPAEVYFHGTEDATDPAVPGRVRAEAGRAERAVPGREDDEA